MAYLNSSRVSSSQADHFYAFSMESRQASAEKSQSCFQSQSLGNMDSLTNAPTHISPEVAAAATWEQGSLLQSCKTPVTDSVGSWARTVSPGDSTPLGWLDGRGSVHSAQLRIHPPGACHRALLDAGEAIVSCTVVFVCGNTADPLGPTYATWTHSYSV